MLTRFFAIPAIFIGFSSQPLGAVEIGRDGFEGGTLSAPLWGAATAATVSTERAYGGTRAVKFHFSGDPDPSADSFSELRFDLSAVYPEVWIRYQLFIPANYVHRNAPGSDNNKFFRMWGNVYDDLEKVGASLWLDSPADGFSCLIADWNRHGEGMGPKGTEYQRVVAAADRGRWMDIVIQAKAATATTFGTMRFWKNGTLIIDGTGTVENYTAGEAHGYRYGYLLGWSNSGFTEDTDLYIDDVIFGTTEADVRPTSGNRPPVAANQSVSATTDTAKPITLTASDADGDVLTYAIATSPAHGLVSGSGASRIYTPAAGYSGTDFFTFTANDGVATSTAARVSITVGPVGDTTPPATPSAPTIAGSDPARPAISGTTEAGATVTIFDDGIPIATALADGVGHWTWNATAPLAPGSHAITVTATDAAGNTSAHSPASQVVVPNGPVPGGGDSSSGDSAGRCGLGSGVAAFAGLLMGLNALRRAKASH